MIVNFGASVGGPAVTLPKRVFSPTTPKCFLSKVSSDLSLPPPWNVKGS